MKGLRASGGRVPPLSAALGGLPITNPGSFRGAGQFRRAANLRPEMARKWRDTVNRHGSGVTVVHLPEVGIHGNTHFPFSDLNSQQAADLMSKFLSEKKLEEATANEQEKGFSETCGVTVGGGTICVIIGSYLDCGSSARVGPLRVCRVGLDGKARTVRSG